MMDAFGSNNWALGLGWIVSLIIVAIIFVIVISLKSNYRRTKPKTAMDILKERYARGEISRDEFNDKKQDF